MHAQTAIAVFGEGIRIMGFPFMPLLLGEQEAHRNLEAPLVFARNVVTDVVDELKIRLQLLTANCVHLSEPEAQRGVDVVVVLPVQNDGLVTPSCVPPFSEVVVEVTRPPW